MGIFIVCIFCSLFLIQIYVDKKWFSSGSLFLMLWTVISFGTLFGSRFGVNEVSLETWSIVMLGVVSFFVGYNLKSDKTISCKNDVFEIKSESNIIKKKIVIIIVIIALPFVINTFIQAITLLKSGYTLSHIRSAYYGIDGMESYWRGTKLDSFAKKYIITPLTTAIVPISITYILRRKFDIYIFLSFLFLVANSIITSGGRYILLYIIVQVIVGYAILKRKIKMKKYAKYIVSVFCVLAVIAILILTKNRNVSGNFFTKIYEYFFCSISMFDYYLPKITEFSFGTGVLHGVISSITTFTNYLIPIQTPYERLIMGSLNVQNAVCLSPTITTNAFVSCFFYAFLDFGILGIIFILFIYGFFCRKTYDNIRLNMSDRSLAIYLLVIQGVVKTIQLMPFTSTEYVLGFIYIIIMTHDFKKKNENKII